MLQEHQNPHELVLKCHTAYMVYIKQAVGSIHEQVHNACVCNLFKFNKWEAFNYPLPSLKQLCGVIV